ncbi:ABC transporter ATP-binding protein [Paracoccus litorisediminis]|uniref:Dipeptide ABC transporter ATP-binding protein n=1 Tax=Paracoccus litorisediminis TaxID=2006130 RepID=A0A844HRB0_9RHOB|nr:ABC transporter ATP-binding protein [Paracoccus litorisediminis]MTH60877.1 dipeptide ABC transporter ATP-binding protein [Paracoccus litorisediminis]
MQPLLSVRNLSIQFPSRAGLVRAVEDVSWDVNAGETLAILGESGSGKSVSASAVMNLIETPPAVIPQGQILFEGQDLLQADAEMRRRINGKSISMIFQDPLAALNPVYPIGWQIAETMRVHGVAHDVAQARVIELLARVGIAEPERRMKDYPHQFSGGQRQRIMIASAIALKPKLLIADEPTSALDVTVQARVLDLLKEIQVENGMGMVLITHDLSVVERVADRVVVMQAGRVVESGTSAQVMQHPQHDYSRRLLAAIPGRAGFSDMGAAKGDILAVRGVSKIYAGLARQFARSKTKPVRAVDDVSFTMAKGETLAVVGESGSGKSTLARMILGLDDPTLGTIHFEGKPMQGQSAADAYKMRRRVQFVFQDPTASLNPRMTVQQIIAEPWAIHPDVLPRNQWRSRVAELLEQVGLKPDHANRHPHQFSGGQRQRIAIARALALKPELIVCDEAVSALDVSVQAQVIDLLKDLRRDYGLSYVFVAHDLALVRDFATSVLVMYGGKIVEKGPVRQIYGNPQHDYTKALLRASGVIPQQAA